MSFGTAGNGAEDDFTTLDIVGHEFTHGLTSATARLEYRLESGALNESFSDIFGEMVEWHTFGQNDWLIGGEHDSPIRNMAAPQLLWDAGFYGGDFWISLGEETEPAKCNDYGGVHTNSGVQNRWFVLLADGGIGRNESNRPFNVTSIGMESAAAIAYRNLTTYLHGQSTYQDAVLGALQAAADIFGRCSPEWISTLAAWEAVGLPIPSDQFGYNLVLCGSLQPGVYEGLNSITAGGECRTIVNANGTDFIFQAAQQITLQSGFTAQTKNDGKLVITPESPCESMINVSATLKSKEGKSRYHSTADVPTTSEEVQFESKSSWSMYPNPTSGLVTVKLTQNFAIPTHLELIDELGTIILKENFNTGLTTFNIKHLKSGIYFCRLIYGNKNEVRKLLLLK